MIWGLCLLACASAHALDLGKLHKQADATERHEALTEWARPRALSLSFSDQVSLASALMPLIHNGSPDDQILGAYAQENILRALRETGTEPHLIWRGQVHWTAKDHPNAEVRATALRALGYLRVGKIHRREFLLLEQSLESPVLLLRLSAALGLFEGYDYPPRAIESLMEEIHHPTPGLPAETRQRILESLSRARAKLGWFWSWLYMGRQNLRALDEGCASTLLSP